MKIPTGQEYAAKIINTKKLSARGGYFQPHIYVYIYVNFLFVLFVVGSVVCKYAILVIIVALGIILHIEIISFLNAS